MKKKVSEIEPGDWIKFPETSEKWVRVYHVGSDMRKGSKGNIYIAIENYGSVSLRPTRELEVE